MITRRRLRIVLALMLPLMALRGLLPAGYMPVAEDGILRIVMCSAGMAMPAEGEDPHRPHDLPPNADGCPFALAAGLLAPPVQQVLGLVAPQATRLPAPAPADQLPPATGPPRAAAARAPPLLS